MRRVRYWRRLTGRPFRTREGRFLIEGVRNVEEAMATGWAVEEVLCTREAYGRPRVRALVAAAEEMGIPVWEVGRPLLEEITTTVAPQGVAALVRQPVWAWEDVLGAAGVPLVVVVDGVQDPGNLGTILRTAAAAGASGAVLLPGTVDPFNPKAVRASAGGIFKIPVVRASDLAVLGELVRAGVRLLMADVAARTELYGVDLTGPVAVAVGGEARRPGEGIRALCHTAVRIPMPGGMESLNVGVACAVVLYEAVRQRLRSCHASPPVI
ncbi:MAG: RNA methyltransferase [Firmicutes bacterium]|nr:RNA methyltransferase [Bacillota bacterium]